MKMERKRKILVKDLNPILTCSLCEGYLIDATVLADCLHVFCRGCIIKYFDNCRTACPNCNIIYKKKNQIFFRHDPQLQSLVYKLVPNLYSKEMQTREDFYRSTGVRASSSCSDDSVIDNERDHHQEPIVSTMMVGTNVSGSTCGEFFSQDDMISLSLEYYKEYLDNTILDKNDEKNKIERNHSVVECNGNVGEGDVKRFLKCPAAVTMQLLQKFLRMKFGLSADHKVDVIYKGEVIANYLTLIDVAYIFKWDRTKPMRFFYRIFTPLKIKPIKIIATSDSSAGTKQLQIINGDKVQKQQLTPKTLLIEETEDQSYRKERLMAHLQLQSTHKKNNNVLKNEEKEIDINKSECVYEYVEPDKEEIKRFAEERDREWALQKKLNEANEHYFKKRKKSKHSKNEVHKKRKLHAEITEDLKLKVKITPHKHKHHKNHGDTNNSSNSTKEKLLEMRQVRHKHSVDDKIKTILPTTKQTIINKITEKINDKRKENGNGNNTTENNNKTVRFLEPENDTKQVTVNREPKPAVYTNTKQNVEKTENEKPKTNTFLKSFQSYTEKYNLEKNKQLRVEIKQTTEPPKTPSVIPPMLKIAPAPPKTVGQLLKPSPVKTSSIPAPQVKTSSPQVSQVKSPTPQVKSPTSQVKTCLNRTIPTIPSVKQGGSSQVKTLTSPPPMKSLTPPVKTSTPPPTSKILSHPPGFTVSKIEAGGVKRKNEGDSGSSPNSKRTGLEITLIPQSNLSNQTNNRGVVEKKRPPPSTIPLERIRKTINLKSGISIIPKSSPSDVCDNVGALDLSNKSPESSPKITKTVNGINMLITKGRSDKPQHQLSNLQMLSKVASEHPILNKLAPNSIKNNNNNVVRTTQSSPSLLQIKPNLPKLQKLTELNKTQFKIGANVNQRNQSARPNQNQNIRNIPNPSLLVRQQNQNRLNSISANVEKDGGNTGSVNLQNKSSPPPPPPPPSQPPTTTPTSNVTVVSVNTVVEKKEISV